MHLSWHRYRYYPYERELALREVAALLGAQAMHEVDGGLYLTDSKSTEPATRLTYFARFANGHGSIETVQGQLENAGSLARNRQATRYSVHGLHEYKGKFNPQVARAVINIFGIRSGQHVLDPFCGSGTTLVECAHLGAIGHGLDLNPLAIFMANAKLRALTTPAATLRNVFTKLSARLGRRQKWTKSLSDSPRDTYLQSWFDPTVLQLVEIVGELIRDTAGVDAPIFLTVASNLLRDYSLQEPNDLRIRRRRSPLPTTPFLEAFIKACGQALDRIEAAQAVLGTSLPIGQATLCDVRTLKGAVRSHRFDAAVTSPPYAMALPYIDTQRLSLVWLDLLPPDRILHLEGELIGSRELRGSERKHFVDQVHRNAADLPEAESNFCTALATALGKNDGFRRQAVPVVLYRYLVAMRDSFRAVHGVLKHGAPFALIVGHNHTVLNGVRYDIDTPAHLTSLAKHVGWRVEELVPLQTYQRYGYHMNNAIARESLIILRKDR